MAAAAILATNAVAESTCWTMPIAAREAPASAMGKKARCAWVAQWARWGSAVRRRWCRLEVCDSLAPPSCR